MKRAPRTRFAGLLLAITLLPAGLAGCGLFGPGPISVDLTTPNPEGLASVFVIVGDDVPKVTDSREVIELVKPDKQASYRAFVQYVVDAGPRWRRLKQTGSSVVEVAPSEKNPGTLEVRLGRKILDNEATCLAIVTSNKEGEFEMLHWDKTALDLVEGALSYEITAGGFRRQTQPK
ncbi:MAG: hypothetical protein V3T22_06930 [Planctomycetota bacterium]